MAEPDTIAAIATPPGIGGIGVVRISGAQVPAITEAVIDAVPPPRQARLATFRDANGSAIDQGLALYFRAPASYTGEHVLELHGHGGPVVMDLLLSMVDEQGGTLVYVTHSRELAAHADERWRMHSGILEPA